MKKFAIILIAMAVGTAQAQTTYVKQNNTTALNAAGSWSAGGPPSGIDTGLWNNTVLGANSSALGGNQTWGQIQITNPGGGATIANTAASTLTLNGVSGTGIDMSAASQDLTINNPVTLGGAQNWTVASGRTLTIGGYTVNNGGNLLTIDGAGSTSLSGLVTGAGGLTKNGIGTLSLIYGGGGNPTYGGPTTVNGGIMRLGGGGSGSNLSGLPTGNITLNGGVFDVYWGDSFTRTLGSGTSNIQIIGGASGFSQLASTQTLSIKLNNNNTPILWGSAFFSPTALVLNSVNGVGTVDFQNYLDLDGVNRTVQVNAGSGKMSGVLSNSSGTAAGITKTGVGRLILTGVNTYNGGTTISAGTVQFTLKTAMPATGDVSLQNDATLAVNVGGAGEWTTGTSGVGTVGGLLAGLGGQSGGTVSYTGNVGLEFVVGTSQSYSADISDVGTSLEIKKSGTGNLTLSGNNSYSGGTTVSAGALIVGSNTAIPSTGTIELNGGTIQSDSTTARSFTNPVTIGGDFTVGGTGNMTFSNTGASALGGTRQITVNNGINATFAQAFSGSGYGITKAGAGTLTLTGANTFTGTTTINAGKIVLNNGTVTGSGVSLSGNNTTLTIQGGSGVNSTWNLGNQDFSGNGDNLQVLIDGDGVAGSAVITNVKILVWGRTATSSTLLLTDGGQMNVNDEIRIGNPYYSENGGANLTIGGGTATSTLTGNSSKDFYIGYGERTGSKNNVVTVSTNGVLANIQDMYVGHINNGQNNDNPTRNNQLLVPGGTVNMRGLSLGYIQTDTKDAIANAVAVTSGGKLSTSGTCYIGRANNATSTSNTNMVTIAGTDSLWNAGNQNVYVGYTANATAASTGNVLTVSAGGVVTNINTLTISATNTLSLGAGGLIYATSVTNSGTMDVGLDPAVTPDCGRLAVSGNLNIANSTLNIVTNGAPASPVYVIASYGTLAGSFAATNGLPATWVFSTNYQGNKIALVRPIPVAPAVVNAGTTNQGAGVCTLQGMLTTGGVANAWICWGTSDAGTSSTSDWSNAVSMGQVLHSNTFSTVVSGLSTNVTYWYRCFASNDYGTAWASPANWFNATPASGGGGGGGGAVGFWTPSNVTLAAWYDAADTSKVLTSGSAVTNWLDKSGNGLYLSQTTGSLQPTTGSTINSLNAIDFTGDKMATASNPFGATINNAFVIAVYKVDSIANGDLFSLTGSDAAANRWQSHAPWGDGNLYFDCGGSGGANRIQAVSGFSAGNVVLASFYCSTADNVQQVYKNGSMFTNDSSGHAVNTAGNISVGGLSNYQDATLGEFIIINGTVNTATRQRLEGYLAWKWGLAANLPAGHPFKIGPPSASGGVVTYTDSSGLNPRANTPYEGGYVVHTFYGGSDTFSNSTATSADVLVVAGGGGGGGSSGPYGSGGGAGGLIYSNSYPVVTGINYTVTVGGGGAGSITTVGGNGTNSVFGSLTALGGGGGSSQTAPKTGSNGGSGGGGYNGGTAGTGQQPGSASGGYGNNGSVGDNVGYAHGGGGGGAGTTLPNSSGDGGYGLAFSISGVNAYYAGGGNGNASTTVVPGGGGIVNASGAANTGGGGGGASAGNAGSGGSGIVIVRYRYGSDSIANLAPTAITSTSVVLNASLTCPSTNYSVYVHWGLVDGTNNFGAWGGNSYVGSWTNVALTNICFTNTSLSAGLINYYTFRATNSSTNIWATPSWRFSMPGLPEPGSIYKFY